MPGVCGIWPVRYLRHSHPQRHAQVTEAYSRLIAHATDEHDLLIAAAGAQRLVARDGFGFVFRTAQAFDEAAHLDRSCTLRPRAVHLNTPREWDAAGH